MKVALVVDYLILRDHYLENFELLVEMFEEANVYCFAHNKGNILGPIEQHNVYSSYLSRFIESKKDLSRWSFLSPSIASTFHIDADTDVVISFSAGLAHTIKIPPKAKHLVYLYDMNPPTEGIIGGIFKSFMQTWSRDTLLKNADQVICSSKFLKKKYALDTADVLTPAFKDSDYPKRNGPYVDSEHYAVHSVGLENKDLPMFLELAKKLNVKFIFVGNDEHLDKSNCQDVLEFWGERCSGELGPILGQARAFIDVSNEVFPHTSVAALAMERPLILQCGARNVEYFKDEHSVLVEDRQELKEAILKMNEEYKNYDGKRMRRNALMFNQGRYKYDFQESVNNLVISQ